MLIDVQYAMRQLRRAIGGSLQEYSDCVHRALGALERVEAELQRVKTPDEIEAEYDAARLAQ